MPGLCKRANIRKLGFHALRRYVASVLADEHKVSAKTIQRLLRHRSVTTTEKYIKKINNDLESTVNLLSNDNKKTKNRVGPKIKVSKHLKSCPFYDVCRFILNLSCINHHIRLTVFL
jgi:integrase